MNHLLTFFCAFICVVFFLNYHLFVCEKKIAPAPPLYIKKTIPIILKKKTHLSPYCAVISIQKSP